MDDCPADAAFNIAVVVVVLTIQQDLLSVLVRAHGGQWALPGGWLVLGETLDVAARRLLPEGAHVEQLRTYGTTADATISVAYLSLLPASGDAQTGRWMPASCLADQLALDHGPILADGVERARAKLECSSLATAFCAEPFTLADLRRVYEAVWGVRLDVPNFRRKVLSTQGLVEPLGRRASAVSGGRPAELYRRGPATVLHPAMLRP